MLFRHLVFQSVHTGIPTSANRIISSKPKIGFLGTRVIIWLIVLCCCVCWKPSFVYAESKLDKAGKVEYNPSDLSDLSLEQLMDIRVVTASKRSERLTESPAAVFVIDKEDIRRYGYRTLAEALQGIAGLYISTDRNFDYLGVRGYLRPGDYNSRILLLIDGQRMNDPMYDIAAVGEDCPIDVESIDRIEVVKGPGSSLWGTNALLATINIFTRTGKDITGGRLSADSGKLFAEYGSTNRSGLDIACGATGFRSHGEDRIYFSEFDSPETNNGIAKDADGARAARGYLRMSYKGLRFFHNIGERRKTSPTAPFGTIFNDPRTNINEARTFTEISYETPAMSSNSRGLFARVYSNDYHYVGHYIYDYPPVTMNVDDYSAKWWGAELRLSNSVTRNLFLVCGAEYMRAYDMSQENHDEDPYYQYFDLRFTQTTRSLYIQADYKMTDRLNLVMGNRYDNFSTFGGTLSPRVALIYIPSQDTSLKALYGSAFRAPNAYELSWQDPEAPTLKPEKIRNLELVWEKKIGAGSRLVTSLYSFEISNIISMVRSEETSHMENQGLGKSSGFEAQLETRTKRGVRAFGGFSLTRTSRDGESIPNSPRYLVTCGASFPTFSGRYVISPRMRAISGMLTRSGRDTDSGATADLVISTVEADRNIGLSLGIYNMFGKTLYAPGSVDVTQDTIPQPGRALRLQASYTF